ncbi:MAG: acyl-CoA dehydrogenase, partial [Alphaproteobacteria bacterium]
MSSDDLYHLSLSDEFRPVVEGVGKFIEEEVSPVTEEFLTSDNEQDRWSLSERQSEILEDLKSKARALGYWNFFLPDWNGTGITNLDYAYLAEQLGKSPIASEVVNCSAPDTGNMEVLHRYGTPAQQQEWLEPLLAGEIRSCFGMTEPGVASSDASNISTRAVLDGNDYVINGEKYYISGAGDSRCKIMILMVNTDPEGHRHQQHTQILVPMDTPGVNVMGPMMVFGHDSAPHGHMHIKLENVRVPKENVILGEGRGFEVAQGRLGPGRIHHCMRAIGQAEKALEMM